MDNMKRYGVINDSKEQMEVVLLRGTGCEWAQCNFCDYCIDYNKDTEADYKLNTEVLDKVTGVFSKLQVICSGSFAELDSKTIEYIHKVVQEKNISTVIFEGHWMHRKFVKFMKLIFNDVELEFIVGAESFNIADRERKLNKGMGTATPQQISKYFNRTNLLFGWKGQTYNSFLNDVELALRYFDKVCINVFTPNTTKFERDDKLIQTFYNSTKFQELLANPRVRILDDLNRDITDTFDLVGEKLSKIGGTK